MAFKDLPAWVRAKIVKNANVKKAAQLNTGSQYDRDVYAAGSKARSSIVDKFTDTAFSALSCSNAGVDRKEREEFLRSRNTVPDTTFNPRKKI